MEKAVIPFLQPLFRAIGMYIDYAIFSLAGGLYDAIIGISKINIFSGEIGGVNLIKLISGNIYAFLGIFMLFRLSVAFIQYIMDPDKLSDSKQGGSKIIVRCLLVVFFIVITPIGFRLATQFQTILLKEDVVTKLVFGSSMSDQLTKDTKNSGDAVAFIIYSNGLLPTNPVFITGVENGNVGVNIPDSGAKATYDALRGDSPTITNMTQVLANQLPLLKSAAPSGGEAYVFDYNNFLALIVGAFLVYVLLITCVDVALRSVKLAFYEMIAPIPIVSYLIPGQDGMLGKWAKECLKTYVSLFITLAGFMFGFLLIIYVGQNFGTIYNKSGSIFVFLFLICGILLFIKKIPDILKGIGLDIGDGMGLSFGKRFGGLGHFLSGAAGTALGMAGGFYASKEAHNAVGSKGLKKAFGIAGGVFAGAARGGVAGYKSKGIGAMYKDSLGAAGKTAAGIYKRSETPSYFERSKNRFKGNLGVYGEEGLAGIKKQEEIYAKYSEEIEASKYDENHNKTLPGVISEKMIKNKQLRETINNMRKGKSVKLTAESRYETAKLEYQNGEGNHTAAEVDQLRVYSLKADSDFKKLQTAYAGLSKVYKEESSIYDAYVKGEDAHDAAKNAEEGKYVQPVTGATTQNTTTQNTPTSNAQYGPNLSSADALADARDRIGRE